jgi:hypothetical protein
MKLCYKNLPFFGFNSLFIKSCTTSKRNWENQVANTTGDENWVHPAFKFKSI